ncbi:MAG: hypothetical protein PHW62_03620 [Candidatus Ratteibacteria bacterium]|nr:hypothetical protein [Candidatus Ratteibacteria bacterium]
MTNQKLKSLYALFVWGFLIAGMANTVEAGEVMSPEVEMRAMVVEISSSELERLGIEKTKDVFSPKEFQIIKTNLETGKVKSKIMAFPPLRTIDGTQATTRLIFLKSEHIFTAAPKIEGDIIKVSMELQLIDPVRMIKTSTITRLRNGETVLISGISNSKPEEGFNILVFITANIIDYSIDE